MRIRTLKDKIDRVDGAKRLIVRYPSPRGWQTAADLEFVETEGSYKIVIISEVDEVVFNPTTGKYERR